MPPSPSTDSMPVAGNVSAGRRRAGHVESLPATAGLVTPPEGAPRRAASGRAPSQPRRGGPGRRAPAPHPCCAPRLSSRLTPMCASEHAMSCSGSSSIALLVERTHAREAPRARTGRALAQRARSAPPTISSEPRPLGALLRREAVPPSERPGGAQVGAQLRRSSSRPRLERKARVRVEARRGSRPSGAGA